MSSSITATPPAGKSPRTMNLLLQSQSSANEPIAAVSVVSPSEPATLPMEVFDSVAKSKRSRTSSFFDRNKTYNCLILINFDNDQVEMVKDSIHDSLAELQGDMDSDDDLPDADMDVVEVDIERVRILQSKEESRKKKAEYRKEYIEREEVKEKRKAKENDPEQKKKREQYSKDPVVRARKADCTKERQGTVRLLKDRDPVLYRQLREEARDQLKKRKPSREPSDDSEEPPSKKLKTDAGSTMDVEQ